MYFATYKDLNSSILNNIHKIPQGIDLIVGVPRSGMLVASIIALYLNKPLSDLNSFLEGKIFENGNTKRTSKTEIKMEDVKGVLIVEDSVASGRSINEVKRKIDKLINRYDIYTYAVYVTSSSKNLVDIYCKIVDDDRIFEWNYLHHAFLSKACFDIDGVLCLDPTEEENDDGDRYKYFLLNAIPRAIPTRKIRYLVTSRLEKYRKETEAWLNKNGIQYENLIMMNISSAEERRKLNNHGEFKASIYKKCSDAVLFVESEPNQAVTIANVTGKAVYCTGNQMYYEEGGRYALKSYIHHCFFRRIKAMIKRVTPEIVLRLYRDVKNK